jgi:hypothetical protein
MRLKFLAVAAAIAIGAATAPQIATAAALPAAAVQQSTIADGSPLQEIKHHRRHRHWHRHHHRHFGRCMKWRHICGDRWGYGTWKQRRCLINHGC